MEFLMKLTKAMVLLVACALLPRTVSYPNGAPIAACTTMIPGHLAISAQTSPPSFAVRTFTDTYTPNERILVILTAPCGGSEMFGGFLLEGRRADSRQNRDVPIGTFNNPAQTKNLDGCGTAGQAVTHRNGYDLKNEIIFEWTAPAQPSGHIVLAATFAVNQTTYWVKVFSKVILDRSDNSAVDSGAEVYPTPTYCDIPPTQPPPVTGPQAPVLPLDSACHETKACMSQCVGLSCNHYVMWSNGTLGVEFHVAARVERTTKTWMAIGFSDDRKMGDDLVVECLSFGNEFRVYTSKNTIRSYGPDNARTTREVEQGIQLLDASLADGVFRCSFLISSDPVSFIDMTREWYLLFASGNTASFRDNKLQHRIESGIFPQVSADMLSFTQAFISLPSTGASIISSECSDDTFGNKCERACSTNCRTVRKRRTCDEVDGRCLNGCKPGWRSDTAGTCELGKPCRNSRFGPRCRTFCHCSDGCNTTVNIQCDGRCAVPWSGPVCQRKNLAHGLKISEVDRSSYVPGRWGSKANDGRLYTSYASLAEYNPFLRIDMERPEPVYSLRIYNGLYNLRKILGFEIEVSNISSINAELCYHDDGTEALPIYDINCTRPLIGRFVRITIKRWAQLTLREVEIYRCEDYWFGNRCDLSCNCYSRTEVCNKVTGYCGSGCRPGLTGPDCHKDCPDGTFGRNCSYKCNCRDKSEVCDKVNGECTSGCNAGWQEPSCQNGDCGNKCGYGTSCVNQICVCLEGFADRRTINNNLDICERDCANVVDTRLKDNTKCLTAPNTECVNTAVWGVYPIYRCICSAGYDISSHGNCTGNTCSDGKYGPSCQYDCHCNSAVDCHPRSGCNGQCAGGWDGHSCQRQNVALHKSAAQSSTFCDRFRCYGANRAIDGRWGNQVFYDTTCSSTADGQSNKAKWNVSLRNSYSIYRFTIYYRVDCKVCQKRLNGFVLSVGSSSVVGSPDYRECYRDKTTSSEGPGIVLDTTCTNGAITGNLVQIQLPKTEVSLALCEVLVYVCSVGWYGKMCDIECTTVDKCRRCSNDQLRCEECILGKWGTSCDETCGNCRNERQCNMTTGVCPKKDGDVYRCAAGFQGDMCTQECRDGLFGQGCSQSCKCLNAAEACDKVTGKCSSGCRDYRRGGNCQDCVDGHFQPNCERCTCFDPTELCNQTTGFCASGCPDGKTGSGCTQDCPAGWYGPNCRYACHCLWTGECKPANNFTCTACQNGYIGTKCNLQNIAVGQITDQSNTASWGGISSLAVDGDRRGNHYRHCTSTGGGMPGYPWWKVTLDKLSNPHWVDQVWVWTRERGRGRLAGFKIFIGYQSKEEDLQLCYHHPNQAPESKTIVRCSSALTGDVILLNKSRTDTLNLCEVEIYECLEFFFGKNCTFMCNCRDSYEVCDRFTGFCETGCNAGYTGDGCQSECPDGTFGHSCLNSCHCMDSTKCNKVTGRCPNRLCAPGFTGENCQSECDVGLYGSECSQTCGACKGGASACRHTDGHCSGCEPGWHGSRCNQECIGTWGEDCRHQCSENCKLGPTECDRFIGSCVNGCLDGFQGDQCKPITKCDDGLYGSECSETCGACKGGASACRPTDGHCSGCEPGWHGSRCNQECIGTWGEDCRHQCSENCKLGLTECDRFNGSCVNGCLDGFQGDQCKPITRGPIPASTLATTTARDVGGNLASTSRIARVPEPIVPDSQGCSSRTGGKDVITNYTYKGKVIPPDDTVPAGTTMLSRCKEFGNYSLSGDSRRQCHQGRWNGTQPSCSRIDFNSVKMPIVSYSPSSIEVTSEGHLRIKDGTRVRLICRLSYMYGLTWTWSTGRKLRSGYTVTNSLPDGETLNGYNTYTVEISFTADQRDSGVFKCKCRLTQYQEATVYVEIM